MRPFGRTALAFGVVLTPLLAQGPVHRFRLDNGLRVILREDQGRRLFRARLKVALRPDDIPSGQEGLADLTLRMMALGEAGHLNPTSFDRALDDSGIRLTRTLSADAITWEVISRGRDQDRAMGLLADHLLRVVMDPSALEPQRLVCWRQQEEALASPEARLRAALGLGGPAAATEQSLGLLTFKDLEAFRQRAFRPDRTVLALEGDLGLEQAKALVILSFGPWAGANLPSLAPHSGAPGPVSPATSPAPVPARIANPGAPLRIEVAAPLPKGLSPALRDLAILLLRSDPALATITRIEPAGPRAVLRFSLAVPTGVPADRALAELRGRIDHLRQRAFTEADLARAKAAWAAGQQIRTLHPEALLADDLLALEGDHTQPVDIEGTTASALNGALAQWLDPARFKWAVMGDPAALDHKE